ncbi:tetratricopeptide repeat protein [Verrucomicrobiota bacterium sgz303538]
MKLRFPFLPRQLLFLCAAGCGLLLTGTASYAQAPASTGPDLVIKQDGSQVQTKVLGVSGTSVQIQVGKGVLGLPLASVKSVQMLPPPEYNAAVQAFEAKDYNKAHAVLKTLTDKFKGLPTAWAQQSTAMLGDVQVELGDLAKAEAAYKDFQRLYPGSPLADIGIAAVSVSKKDFATAKQKLEPVTAKALQEKNVPSAMALAYSKAFYLLGQAKEADGNVEGALEDYLRTVTVFYHDRASVSLAQQKADAIRKAHPDVFVP